MFQLRQEEKNAFRDSLIEYPFGDKPYFTNIHFIHRDKFKKFMMYGFHPYDIAFIFTKLVRI